MKYKLLAVNSDAKTVRGLDKGFLTGILYLSAADTLGFVNLCTRAGACKAGCLVSAGRGAFDSVWDGRARKTLLLVNDRAEFLRRLRADIFTLIRDATAQGKIPCLRLNGTSDLPWLALQMSHEFPEMQFYDYSKLQHPWTRVRANYHITQSFDPVTVPWSECKDALDHGINVAVVFRTPKGKPLPQSWNGIRVVDGDLSDLRFLDDRGVIVGVRAKGKAKQDTTGFVVCA